MGAVLLDTSVASLLHPKRAGAEARAFYEPYIRSQVLAVSFQTQAELWAWAEDGRWGPAMRAGLERFLTRFAVVPYTEQLGRTWARVMIQARRSGRRLEAGDGWIASVRRPVQHSTAHAGRRLPGPGRGWLGSYQPCSVNVAGRLLASGLHCRHARQTP